MGKQWLRQMLPTPSRPDPKPGDRPALRVIRQRQFDDMLWERRPWFGIERRGAVASMTRLHLSAIAASMWGWLNED
jgi:hypothetical protein